MLNYIELILGDITKLKVDALINAANSSLLGGGGVDGAIHRAAGPELLEECRKLNGCKTGAAKITKGYNLPAKWVIHTVGPVWRGGGSHEEELLCNCYRNSLELARQNDIKTLAFPSISTGAYRFPVDKASRIALDEIIRYLEEYSCFEKIFLVCFDEKVYQCYKEVLNEKKSDLEKRFRDGLHKAE
ncbi:MAG: O-acetyl-ADP-ribose deacetylase [Clostridia bacterium]|nr:O-acetyl-ADP-ribose deacetylase [Clostridia bacterium]